MQCLDYPFPSPAELLAADEALLDRAEAGHGGELLAFWEPHAAFVVVGYANQVAVEVNPAACTAAGVPVFRRCSGGGTVVQMPGGLNYSLILRITESGPTRNISAANQFIMEKNRVAIQAALGPGANEVSVRGHTDLALAPRGVPHPVLRKFAGNAQRRRRQFLLFHGTLLLNCDLPRIAELLPMPSAQPDYRADRPHDAFVTNLNLPAATVKAALAQAWEATPGGDALPLADIHRLAQEKYATPAWNYKF
jgi:lipoate-protein ligase A